jgi:hypothetical protein
MSWADKKIREYQKGANSTFLERRNLEHANPVLFTLLLVAIVIAAYGAWMHDWTLIILAAIVASIGHVYVWLIK